MENQHFFFSHGCSLLWSDENRAAKRINIIILVGVHIRVGFDKFEIMNWNLWGMRRQKQKKRKLYETIKYRNGGAFGGRKSHMNVDVNEILLFLASTENSFWLEQKN